MILDTNALSALAARDPNASALIRTAPRLCVTLISLGEFQFGILGSSKKAELTQWLEAFLERAEVLSPNSRTLPYYASLRLELKSAGTPIPANDVWIAAITRQHNMSLVSLDIHFDKVIKLKRLTW